MASAAHKKDGYLNLYFHPWEFTDLHDKDKFGFPGYVSKNSGEAFAARIADFIDWATDNCYTFERTDAFCSKIKNKSKLTLVL